MSRFRDSPGKFFAEVWERIEVPILIIVEHFIVTIASLISIAAIEFTVRMLGLGEKIIPYTHCLLVDFLFILEVIASTIIIATGIYKAARELMK